MFSSEVKFILLVDKKEAIFRINKATTKGFESKVGHRTDYRILNNQIIEKLSSASNLSYLTNEETLLTYIICDGSGLPMEEVSDSQVQSEP